MDAEGRESSRSDSIAAASEPPEASSAVDRDVRDGAGVLGGINHTKVVRAGGVVLQVNGEHRGGQLSLRIVVKALLSSRGDCRNINQYVGITKRYMLTCVEALKCQSDETISG